MNGVPGPSIFATTSGSNWNSVAGGSNVATSTITPAFGVTDWIFTCASFSSNSSYIIYVNGKKQTSTSATLPTVAVASGTFGINLNTANTGSFAIAEAVFWSRALAESDLYLASYYFSSKCVPRLRNLVS